MASVKGNVEALIKRSIWSRKKVMGKSEREVLEKLENTALATVRQMRVLNRFKQVDCMETKGRVFDFVAVWYLSELFAKSRLQRDLCCKSCAGVDENMLLQVSMLDPLDGIPDEFRECFDIILHSTYFKKPLENDKAKRNPYFRLCQELSGSWLRGLKKKLKFLEQDRQYYEQYIESMELHDPSDTEIRQLAEALRGGSSSSWIALLMKPLQVLTHFENFQLALFHARLWLLRSELPVAYASTLTYKDLRGSAEGDLASTLLLLKEKDSLVRRIRDPLPSVIEANLMCRTVFLHSVVEKRENPNEEDKPIYHIKLEDFSEKRNWKTPGEPTTKSSFILKTTTEIDKDDVKSMIRRARMCEPRIWEIITSKALVKM